MQGRYYRQELSKTTTPKRTDNRHLFLYPPLHHSPFTFDTKFSASDAREDKVDLELSGWAVVGLGDEGSEHVFKGYMSSPPAGSEDMAWKSNDEAARYGWLFLRPHLEGKDRNKLLIRKQVLIHPQDRRRHEAPLCAGHCLFYRNRKSRLMPIHLAKLRLSLNVQRFTRHQYQSDDPTKLKYRLQRCQKKRSTYGDEFALDGEDNWLPQGSAWASAHKAEHLAGCVHLIARELERDLERACTSSTGLEQIGDEWASIGWERENESYRLQKVETLWEFPSENPIGDVLQIGAKLMHFNREGAIAREFSRVRNSPCFVVPIGEDVELKLYAKTNRRIRFEVVQSNLGRRRGELLAEAGILVRKDEEWKRPFSEIPKVMKAIRERAAAHMNQVMDEIRGVKIAPVKACSVVKLLSEVTAAVFASPFMSRRHSDLQTLLFCLCYQRGYRGQIKKGPLTIALSTLEKRGVLTFDRARQFYKLAKDYEGAADALFAATGDPILAVFGMDSSQYRQRKPGTRPVFLRED